MARFVALAHSLLIAISILPIGVFADEGEDGAVVTSENQVAETSENSDTDSANDMRLLRIEALSAELGFEGGYDWRRTRYDTRQYLLRTYTQTNRASYLQETLGLKARGAIVDPKWLLFDVAFEGGAEQEWFDESGRWYDRSYEASGESLSYDAQFTILPRGKLSGTAYAQRLDSRVPRAFLPSLERTRERYGGGLYFNDATLPMRLTFEHIWDDLHSRTYSLDDDEKRGRDTLRYEATWQIDKDHSLRLEYEYDDRTEQYSGSDTRFDTLRHYLTLNHTLRFGQDRRSSLENLARFQEESGELGRDIAEWQTRLRLQHTDALSSNYAFQYLRDRFQQLETETIRGEGGLTWNWDDRLILTGQLYALDQDVEEGSDFREYGGLLNASYNQENEWGRFSANASYNHVTSDSHNGTRRGIVIGESVMMRDPLASYLAQADVDLATIVVTNATRTRTYLPARDYIAIRAGRYTSIRRVANGQIADRETVLVSYTYRVAGNYDVARNRFDVRVQQAFDFGLTPYYAGSFQDEQIDGERFLRYSARDVQRHRIGATYRQRRWSLGAEYEYNDDSIDPYQAVHANGDVVLWQNATSQLDGKATASQFWFDGTSGLEDRDTLLFDCGLSYRHLLRQNLELNGAALYRYEDDSYYGITHGVDLTAALEWKIGFFGLRFEAEYDMLDLPGSRDDGASFWIKLKREIPLVAKRDR